MQKGKIPVRPKWLQISFEDLEEELEWVQKPGKQRALVICSCPSQIDDDKTIMRQVEEICKGRDNVELTFSEAGSATSQLFENMSFGGGGGGAAAAPPTLARVDSGASRFSVSR